MRKARKKRKGEKKIRTPVWSRYYSGDAQQS